MIRVAERFDRRALRLGRFARRAFDVYGAADKASAESAVPLREGEPHEFDPRLIAGRPLAMRVIGDHWLVHVGYGQASRLEIRRVRLPRSFWDWLLRRPARVREELVAR